MSEQENIVPLIETYYNTIIFLLLRNVLISNLTQADSACYVDFK